MQLQNSLNIALKLHGATFFLFNKWIYWSEIVFNVALLAQGEKKEEGLVLTQSGFMLAMEFVLLQALWSTF